MSFGPENIFRHKLSTIIGVLIALIVGIVLFLLVYLGKATVAEITPLSLGVLPIVLSFLLYGKRE